MANIQGVIAGISIDKSNEIKPSFDAMVYDFIVGQDGHSLVFSTSGTTLTVNGFAIANGIRGFFENAQITIATTGFLYVLFTTHQSENVADTVELEWSATALTETHDNIGSVAGIYRMKVLTVESGTATVNNKIQCVLNAVNADEAEIVTTTIAENAVATTQESNDDSTKVATTAFVQAAITARKNDFANAQATIAVSVTTTTNSLTKQARSVVFNFDIQQPSSAVAAGDTIATLPINFRPTADLIVYCRTSLESASSNQWGRVKIDTNGILTLQTGYFGGGYTGSASRIQFQTGFITE